MKTRYDFGGNLQGSYLSANYVLQHSTQLNRQLADVPQHRANLIANWAFDNTWSSFAHLLVKDSTSRNLGDVRGDTPGYALFDVGLLGKNMFGRKIDIGFNVYNLCNYSAL